MVYYLRRLGCDRHSRIFYRRLSSPKSLSDSAAAGIAISVIGGFVAVLGMEWFQARRHQLRRARAPIAPQINTSAQAAHFELPNERRGSMSINTDILVRRNYMITARSSTDGLLSERIRCILTVQRKGWKARYGSGLYAQLRNVHGTSSPR
jgi:hypothetical protein